MRTHLASLVDDFRGHASETAVVSHRGVRRYATTYGELAQLAGRFAAELSRRGIGPGERVLLWGDNSAIWLGAFFGCLLRGVLAVPLDAASSPAFAARIANEVRPRLIVGDAERLKALATATPALTFAELEQVLPALPLFAVDPAVTEDAPFQIVFTSGTTSEPKGIVHTHRNVLASLRPIEAEIVKYRRYERCVHPLRFLHTLPLSHVFGQFMGMWVPALLAAEVHFTDALEPGRMVEHMRRERISVLIAVPRVLDLLRAHLAGAYPWLLGQMESADKLSIWKRWWRFRAVHSALGWKFWALISGGASLPEKLEMFWNTLGFALIQGYGMTETAALVTLNHPFRVGRGTIGKPLPGREVRLSETGELLVRGEMVAGATWQGGELRRREGEWLATGDLAERNDAGEFRFMGRTGDAIVSSSGMNIFAVDLETAMKKQPGVQECAVVACEFASGPEPVCVVRFHGDEDALQQAVRQANAELSEFQQIRRVLRWTELAFPYTSTGKLLKRSIQNWACAKLADGNASAPTDDALLKMIAGITGDASGHASGDASGHASGHGGDAARLSEDLHLDSLGRVQLASQIEQRTGVGIGDAEMAALQTVGQVRELLTNQTVAAVERPATVYPRWPWSMPIQWIRSVFVEAVMRPLIGFFLTPSVVRAEQSRLRGPMLIVANHVTLLDGALILYGLPPEVRRRVAAAMSGEMLAAMRSGKGVGGVVGPAAYWLLTALFNVFPLPRLQGFRQSFAHAGDAMDRGHSVLIFPEGTRSHSGQIAPFRPGIGLLATQCGVPVLPVALVGLVDLRDRRVGWFRSGRLEVRMGAPIPWTERMSAAEWTAQLEAAVRALHR